MPEKSRTSLSWNRSFTSTRQKISEHPCSRLAASKSFDARATSLGRALTQPSPFWVFSVLGGTILSIAMLRCLCARTLNMLRSTDTLPELREGARPGEDRSLRLGTRKQLPDNATI